MDWIKVKIKHAEYQMSAAPDNVFKAWIMVMAFVAATECKPLRKHLCNRLGENNITDLENWLVKNDTKLDAVIDKVLEDVEHLNRRKAHERKYMSKYRSKTLRKGLRKALCNGKDKIREDKIREDKRESSTSTINLSKEEHKSLIETYGSGPAKEYMDRLIDYAAQFPAKFAKYASHYATIRNWLRRDGIKKLPPKSQVSKEELRHDPKVAELIRKTTVEIGKDGET